MEDPKKTLLDELQSAINLCVARAEIEDIVYTEAYGRYEAHMDLNDHYRWVSEFIDCEVIDNFDMFYMNKNLKCNSLKANCYKESDNQIICEFGGKYTRVTFEMNFTRDEKENVCLLDNVDITVTTKDKPKLKHVLDF